MRRHEPRLTVLGRSEVPEMPIPLAIRLAAAACLLCSALRAGAQQPAPIDEATPDWMMSIPLSNSSAKVRPPDRARVEQTPPDFSWPDLSPDARYRITLTYPDGRARSRPAPQNWINWNEVLPAGNYSWQVQVTNASGTQTSRTRRFTVDANARPFLVPDANTLYKRATTRSHPRALPDAATLQAMLAQRRAALSSALTRIHDHLGAARRSEPASTSTGVIETETVAECERILNTAFAYVATKEDKYYVEALRRALNLASWDPRGSTSYASADQAARLIAATLTLAYDWLFPRLDATQRRLLLAALKIRVADMYTDLFGVRARIAIHPYNSHGNHTLTFLAAMATVLAGDIPEAENWMRDSLPLAMNWTSPWGGEDGGFGNGTAYATWVTGDLLVAWYILRWTVGIDVAQKAWVRNYAKFLAYYIPPGTPSGVFGDAAERPLTENWARFGKTYTLFAPSPLGRWYASQLTGEDASKLQSLLAPPADLSPALYPAGTPDSALFHSIGWAAMHSSLSDPERVSVYFKASPYGSYNHSHADQNSFIVNAGGRVLAIDSGYYDGYKTPHWLQWYKQTRAHNAITFDGGQGQVVFEESGKLGPGAITGYVHQPDYDIVTGDAAPAYGGALTEATRSLVYLRPNLILVYDKLASGQARQWEWNIHALNPMQATEDRRVTIRNGGETLCMEMLAGPPVAFVQNNRFGAEPQGQNVPEQWHGAFVSKERSTATEFVALMRVGCSATAAGVSKTNGAWTVVVAGKTVTLRDSTISVK
jgi:hypothetical protein